MRQIAAPLPILALPECITRSMILLNRFRALAEPLARRCCALFLPEINTRLLQTLERRRFGLLAEAKISRGSVSSAGQKQLEFGQRVAATGAGDWIH